MSLFDQTRSFYEIKLYYKFAELSGGNKKLVILDDDKAEKMMEDGDRDIEVLVTQWASLNWREQNEVAQLSARPTGPQGQKEFSYVVYRDSIVKRCLKQWDITMNEKPVPVTPDAIDNLPGDVVAKLYSKFEKILDYTEDELKNQPKPLLTQHAAYLYL